MFLVQFEPASEQWIKLGSEFSVSRMNHGAAMLYGNGFTNC